MADNVISLKVKSLINSLYSNNEIGKLYNALSSVQKNIRNISDNDLKLWLFNSRFFLFKI